MTGLTSKQMSILRKRLLNKGYSTRTAWKKTGQAKKISKGKYNSKWKKGKFGKDAYIDYDGDGKVNRYDCKPFNKYEQDNIGVVGSRSSNELQKKHLEKVLELKCKEGDRLVSGGCRGPDTWGEDWAKRNNMETIIHKPTSFTAQEFHNRNKLIAKDSDKMIALIPENPNPNRFAGTEQTVREAINQGKPVRLIKPSGKHHFYNRAGEEI